VVGLVAAGAERRHDSVPDKLLDHSSTDRNRVDDPLEVRMRNIAEVGESAKSEQLQQASGLRNNEIQPTISSLIQKGLIYRPERARVAFTAPMFGAFLRRTPD